MSERAPQEAPPAEGGILTARMRTHEPEPQLRVQAVLQPESEPQSAGAKPGTGPNPPQTPTWQSWGAGAGVSGGGHCAR